MVAFIWSYSPYRRKSLKKKNKPTNKWGKRKSSEALSYSESFLNLAPCVMQLARFPV